MKKRIFFLTMLLFAGEETFAQINIVPFVGINNTKMNVPYDPPESGGTFGLVGFELELRKKPKKHHALYLSVVTGLSYLRNGFNNAGSLSLSGIFYFENITNLKMQYLQVPVVARINWQPFPLIEEWQIFFGAGISNNILLKSHLAEEYTYITISDDFIAPPETTHYEDSGDVTSYGKRISLFRRFELGMKYKRIHLAFRLSKSLSDMYYVGIEDSWDVPSEHSYYINGHQANGKTTEKYSELIVGFRVGR